MSLVQVHCPIGYGFTLMTPSQYMTQTSMTRPFSVYIICIHGTIFGIFLTALTTIPELTAATDDFPVSCHCLL